LLEEPSQAVIDTRFLSETHLKLGRVDIHVNLARRQGQQQTRHRVPITRQQSAIRFVQSVAEHTILYGTAINKEKLLASRGTMQSSFGNIAIHLQVGDMVFHGQHLVLKTYPKQHLQPLTEARSSGCLYVQTPVQM
jgi:hypothetical protein